MNVNDNNWVEIKELLKRQNNRCSICKSRFTDRNHPTLDRQDNKIGHTLDNVKFACLSCNRLKSNRDPLITQIKI
jgi:hypothetical protein